MRGEGGTCEGEGVRILVESLEMQEALESGCMAVWEGER